MTCNVLFAAVVLSLSASAKPTDGLADPRTLAEMRNALVLRSHDQGQLDRVVGGISLAGFSWFREVDLGRDNRAVVISCNRGGGLIVFGPDSRLIGARKTDEITSFCLFDLDEDGISEVLTDEVEGEGTGYLVRRACLYRVLPGPIEVLWTGVSLDHNWSWDLNGGGARLTGREGFVRLDPSGGGYPACIRHLVCDANGSACVEKLFVLKGGSVQQVPELGQTRGPH